MREIKFRAWHKEAREYCEGTTANMFRWLEDGKPIILEQYTGLKDKNGVEIYDGDLLNVFFTSSNGEHIHDCIYSATKGALGNIQFAFVGLLWSCYGHNQYPSSAILCERHESLDYEHEENEIKLKVPDSWGENHLHGNRWKQNDKSFYFEVIGNIYENPELLEK